MSYVLLHCQTWLCYWAKVSAEVSASPRNRCRTLQYILEGYMQGVQRCQHCPCHPWYFQVIYHKITANIIWDFLKDNVQYMYVQDWKKTGMIWMPNMSVSWWMWEGWHLHMGNLVSGSKLVISRSHINKQKTNSEAWDFIATASFFSMWATCKGVYSKTIIFVYCIYI